MEKVRRIKNDGNKPFSLGELGDIPPGGVAYFEGAGADAFDKLAANPSIKAQVGKGITINKDAVAIITACKELQANPQLIQNLELGTAIAAVAYLKRTAGAGNENMALLEQLSKLATRSQIKDYIKFQLAN